MLINPKIYDAFTLELNNPLTEEQWDILEDVDFDHTEHIWFHTKHGKEVHFYKNAIPIEWLHSIMEKQLIFAMESEMEGTTTVQDGVIHCVSGAVACQVLANVIELWEKENEKG